jgi:hypothetical protein
MTSYIGSVSAVDQCPDGRTVFLAKDISVFATKEKVAQAVGNALGVRTCIAMQFPGETKITLGFAFRAKEDLNKAITFIKEEIGKTIRTLDSAAA